MTKVLTPDCPTCGHPPKFKTMLPYFCSTEDCAVVSWDPTMTLAALRKVVPYDLSKDLDFTEEGNNEEIGK